MREREAQGRGGVVREGMLEREGVSVTMGSEGGEC